MSLKESIKNTAGTAVIALIVSFIFVQDTNRLIFYMAIYIAIYWILHFAILKWDDLPSWVEESPSYFAKINGGTFVIFFVVIGLIIKFGSRTPGSLIERRYYKNNIYVRLYPNDELVKSYKVPALIYRTNYDPGYSDQEGGSSQGYFIKYAFMPNGGIITFSEVGFDFETNSELSDMEPQVILGEKTDLKDTKGRIWGVELTDEVVKE